MNREWQQIQYGYHVRWMIRQAGDMFEVGKRDDP